MPYDPSFSQLSDDYLIELLSIESFEDGVVGNTRYNSYINQVMEELKLRFKLLREIEASRDA